MLIVNPSTARFPTLSDVVALWIWTLWAVRLVSSCTQMTPTCAVVARCVTASTSLLYQLAYWSEPDSRARCC